MPSISHPETRLSIDNSPQCGLADNSDTLLALVTPSPEKCSTHINSPQHHDARYHRTDRDSLLSNISGLGIDQPCKLLDEILTKDTPLPSTRYRINYIPWPTSLQESVSNQPVLNTLPMIDRLFGFLNNTPSERTYLQHHLSTMCDNAGFEARDPRRQFITTGRFYTKALKESNEYSLVGALLTAVTQLREKPVQEGVSFIQALTASARGHHGENGTSEGVQIKLALEEASLNLHEPDTTSPDEHVKSVVNKAVHTFFVRQFDQKYNQHSFRKKDAVDYHQQRIAYLASPATAGVSPQALMSEIRSVLQSAMRDPKQANLRQAIKQSSNQILLKGDWLQAEGSAVAHLCTEKYTALKHMTVLSEASVYDYLAHINVLQLDDSLLHSASDTLVQYVPLLQDSPRNQSLDLLKTMYQTSNENVHQSQALQDFAALTTLALITGGPESLSGLSAWLPNLTSTSAATRKLAQEDPRFFSTLLNQSSESLGKRILNGIKSLPDGKVLATRLIGAAYESNHLSNYRYLQAVFQPTMKSYFGKKIVEALKDDNFAFLDKAWPQQSIDQQLEGLSDTALTYASRTGRIKLMRYLLSRGANPMQRDYYNGNPLSRAIAAYETPAVNLLLSVGASLSPQNGSLASTLQSALSSRDAELYNTVLRHLIALDYQLSPSDVVNILLTRDQEFIQRALHSELTSKTIRWGIQQFHRAKSLLFSMT